MDARLSTAEDGAAAAGGVGTAHVGMSYWFGVEFRTRVADNLAEGAFRLVFAVDEITEDLERAVEYLNAHTTTALEVIVLEFRYSRVEGLEVLLPNSFGEEAARRKHSARTTTHRWTESTFFEAAEGAIHPCRIVLSAAGVLVRVRFDLARKRPRAALEAVIDHLTELPAFAAIQDEIRAADLKKRPGLAITEYGDEGIELLVQALDILLAHPPEEE
jgi:hypothetical protein